MYFVSIQQELFFLLKEIKFKCNPPRVLAKGLILYIILYIKNQLIKFEQKCLAFSMVLGKLPPMIIAPNPKTNPNLNENPNPNQGAIFLGANCQDTAFNIVTI